MPQKASQSSGKSARLAQHAANDRLHLFDATCARRWPQSRRFFNFDHAELREFQTQSCAISSRKCAQRATKARRVNPNALHAVWQLPATSAQLLLALGACRAQKSRRIASKFSRVSPKIASFRRRLSCKKQRRAQEKLRVLRNVQQTIIHIILMQRACVGGRNRADFQNF